MSRASCKVSSREKKGSCQAGGERAGARIARGLDASLKTGAEVGSRKNATSKVSGSRPEADRREGSVYSLKTTKRGIIKDEKSQRICQPRSSEEKQGESRAGGGERCNQGEKGSDRYTKKGRPQNGGNELLSSDIHQIE